MLKKSLKRPCTSGAGTLTSFGFTVSGSENSDKSETESICADEPQSPAKRLKAQHHRASGFDPEWPKSYPWVEEFQNGMRCKLCVRHQQRSKRVRVGEAVWVDIPCVTIAKNSLDKHAIAEYHQAAVGLEAELRSRTSNIEKSVQKMTSVNKMARMAAFRGLYWLAKEEIPHTTKYKSLLDLCKEQGLSYINNLNQGDNNNGESERFIQEALMTMAQIIQEPILEDIRQADYYNLLLDETTDIEVVKELIIYIRYVKAGSSHTQFIKIVPLVDGTASSIVSAVTTLLADLNIPLAKLCALGSDGAAVMVGRKNGVAAKLKDLVPHLISNHCVAHRLALAAAQSIKDIPYLKKFKDILDQLLG